MKKKNDDGSASSDVVEGGKCLRRRLQFPGTIRKNGSSYYVTIPGQYLAKMGLKEGADVNITISLPTVDADEAE